MNVAVLDVVRPPCLYLQWNKYVFLSLQRYYYVVLGVVN